jgi:diketogulonate reductase-like aldo/keto reductase
MEKLVDEGVVRSIGVSNFQEYEMQTILDAKPKVKPAINQVECHPYWNQDALQKWQEKHDILLQCYSPLGNPSFKPQDGRPNPFPLTNPLIEKMAAEKKATAAQVALAWAIARGRIVIPKSVKPARIQENFDAYKVQLTPEEIKAIDQLSYGEYRQRLANPRNRPGGLPVFADDRATADEL